MNFLVISWGATILLFAFTLSLLLTRDWRWILALLAAQYIAVFWLTQIHWTVSMAAVKLVTGWMSATVLGITRSTLDPKLASAPDDNSWPQGRFFRILTAMLIFLLVASAAPSIPKLLPGIGLPEVTGSLTLMTMGLLMLGLTTQPLRVVIGLLTLLAGFEILYAAVENATLVAALLAVINLGLALVGSYLLLAGTEDTGGSR
ncbi:MAG: hypothetical protein HN390_12840 [Anaerolineae bacterium]|jgi:hypothetical protein|nr:hypothetical protein [Anaerolineae bacterium]MBT7990851.1 hypothetical protein [Anaerolineae bacterium]